jgi:hypothetical protein
LGFRFHRREILFRSEFHHHNHNLLVYYANSEEQQGGEMYSAAAARLPILFSDLFLQPKTIFFVISIFVISSWTNAQSVCFVSFPSSGLFRCLLPLAIHLFPHSSFKKASSCLSGSAQRGKFKCSRKAIVLIRMLTLMTIVSPRPPCCRINAIIRISCRISQLQMLMPSLAEPLLMLELKLDDNDELLGPN